MSRKKKSSSPLPQAWLAEVRDDLSGKIKASQSSPALQSKTKSKKSKSEVACTIGEAKSIDESSALKTKTVTRKSDPVPTDLAVRTECKQHGSEDKRPGTKRPSLPQAWLDDVRQDLNSKILIAEKQQKGQSALTTKPKRRRGGRAKNGSDTGTSPEALHKKPGAQFLDLPVEIQTTILEYTLLQTSPIRMDALFRSLPRGPSSWKTKGCGIIYACHDLHEIGRQAFYSGNTFTVSIGLFSSMPSTMASWPLVPKAATNLAIALEHVRHLVVVHAGWNEVPGPNGPQQWKPLVQFLRGFRRILSLEIDLREDDWAGIGWGKPQELDYFTEVAGANIRKALNRGGVRIGWSPRENGRGVKNGSVHVRKRHSQTEHNIREASRKLLAGIEEGVKEKSKNDTQNR